LQLLIERLAASGIDSGKSRAEQAAAAAERRKTYPAGRILHLVPRRFVFSDAAAHSVPVAEASGASEAAMARHFDGFGPGQHSGRSQRSESEYDSSEELSTDEDAEDDLWEEMDTPDIPQGASPEDVGQPHVWGADAQQPAEEGSSLAAARDMPQPEGSYAMPSAISATEEPAPGVDGSKEALDPIAAAVAIVGVRSSPSQFAMMPASQHVSISCAYFWRCFESGAHLAPQSHLAIEHAQICHVAV